MRILIVSQYFWPEAFIINDLAIQLKKLGHEVTIFTGKPNYPDGNLYPGYKQSGTQEELFQEDIPVFRVPLKPRKKANARSLILNYLSFICSGLFHARGFSKNRGFDSILVFAPSPITSAIPALLLKWLTKSHLSIWIQDLWPESLQATGYVQNQFILRFVQSLVRGIYKGSDTLLVQSKAFIPQVFKLAPNKEILYYPNSVKDTLCQEDSVCPIPHDLDHLLSNAFCLVFAGNIGTVQAVGTILSAAIQLKDIPDLKIVLIGSGSQLDWVKGQIAEHQLNNLILAGRFPFSSMPSIFSKASALLVTLKRDEIFTYTIPSKIQAYLASGKPIIAALDGEGAQVILEAGAGFTSPAEEPEKLVNNIKKMYHLPLSEREELGRSGRAYFLKHFEMNSQSQKLIAIIEDRIKKRNHSK